MKIRHLLAGITAVATLVAALFATSALAQQSQRVRGTIESADGSSITVKQAEGPDVTVKLADNVQVFGVVAEVTVSEDGHRNLPHGTQTFRANALQ